MREAILKLADAILTLADAVRSANNSKDTTTTILHRIENKLEKIMATEADVVAALKKIDDATTKAGANIQTIADTTQTISDEVDALETALKNAGVSQALIDQATALGTKAQAVSDSLDAHAAFLTAIATKGATNPVPVPVPPAPTPTP